MDRNQRHHRRAGASWLLLLAVVAVLAPVWADTYVCPMAKAAPQEPPSCCARTEVAPLQAPLGTAQLEPPCDCPKLSWNAGAADQARELRTGSDPAPALAIFLPSPLAARTNSVTQCFLRPELVLRAAPPLWRLNQAILC